MRYGLARFLSLLGVGLASILALTPCRAEPLDRGGGVRILDVPYVPQSDALCGGASLAMVLRYWGERQVYAEDFSSLLDEELGGIRGSALIEEVRSRGWRALPFEGDEESVEEHLSRGRPLIALIEDRPGFYHYVVLVGYAHVEPDQLVLHDPSVASFRVVEAADFEAAWRATERWTLLVLPPTGGDETSDPSEEAAGVTPSPCSPLVGEAVLQVGRGELEAAGQLLRRASELCPRSSVPPRELAGVRLLQSRFEEAAHLAEHAVAIDPGDLEAWRLLASSRFLLDDEDGALEAWAHTGELEVDLAQVGGLARTPYRVVADQLDLPPGTFLTGEGLRRARRRLSDLPAVSATRVGYRPVAGGLAEIDVAVVERPLLTDGPMGLAAESLRALFDREVSVSLSNALERGERWTASWRWWEERPRVSLSLAAPRPGGLPGIWHFRISREEQTYGFGTESLLIRAARRHASVAVGDWATSDSRWEVEAGFDRWDHRGDHVSVGGALERRLAGDRLSLRAEAQGWSGADGGDPFATARLSTKWRSSDRNDGVLWLGRVGFDATSANAPLDLWSGAGVGHGRPALLRAHPLLKDGVLDVESSAFGTYLVHGGLEMQDWVAMTGPVRWGFAIFTDVARSWKPLDGAVSVSPDVDVGAGLRVRLLGQAGALRMDAGHGLRDGSFALSAAWQMDWPN